MCGIAAVVGADQGVVLSALAAMVGRMRHRGPDDEGLQLIQLRDGRWLGLGQRRLSIIDLSACGHQPMIGPARRPDLSPGPGLIEPPSSGVAADGRRAALVYNGELYNFRALRHQLTREGARFKGDSDSEVVLHALERHGPNILARFNGMYALAFFEPRDQTLLLARDPMGIKPLYVAEAPGGVHLVASEVRAILASGLVPAQIDQAGLAALLAHQSIPEPLTFFKNVRCFPAGSMLRVSLRADPGFETRASAVPVQHWSFPPIDPRLDEVAAINRLRSTLDDAVRDHLVADVPVGVFLSAGLDSTVVAGLAGKHSPRMRAFTIDYADQPDLTEAPVAAESARRLGLRHHQIKVSNSDALGLMRRWLDSLDQPSLDGLNTFVISQAVRREGIIVALSGLGGDELLGGYPAFANVPSLCRWNSRLSFVPGVMRAMLFSGAGLGRPDQVRDKLADIGREGDDPLRVYIYRRRLMSGRRLRALGLDAQRLGLDRTYMPPSALADAPPPGDDLIAAVSRFESLFYMRNVLLRDSDANAMAHGLELRVPMLDRRMLDLGHQIPGPVRLPHGVADKHLLRRAFPDLLRPELLKLKKRGFTLPIRRWMAGPMRDDCHGAIDAAANSGLLNGAEVRRVWSRFLAEPEMQVWSSAFMLVVLGKYLMQLRAGPA